MSERKALLILHGKQALNEEVRTAVEGKRQQGWELAVQLTWETGDAQRWVEEALTAPGGIACAFSRELAAAERLESS